MELLRRARRAIKDRSHVAVEEPNPDLAGTELWIKPYISQAQETVIRDGKAIITGVWGSGKTVLAEATATLIEPDSTKKGFIYLTGGVSAESYEGNLTRNGKINSSILVIDEVTDSELATLEVILSLTSAANPKIILIAPRFPQVSPESIIGHFAEIAQDSLPRLSQLLSGIVNIDLPNELSSNAGNFPVIHQVRDPQQLSQLLKK